MGFSSMKVGRSLLVFGALALTIGLLGCAQQEQLAPVTGVVTIDGKPYPGGKVIFSPTAKEGSDAVGRPSFGIPDEQGRFSLSCFKPNDGAIVGDHIVTLFRAVDHDEIRPDLKALGFKRVNLRGERVTVTSGDNTIDVALTSEEIQKYGNRL